MTDKQLATVVVPVHPAPAPPPEPPASNNCAYQIEVSDGGHRAYQCLTQQEWDARQAQVAAENQATDQWIAANWYWPFVWVIAIFIAWFILKGIWWLLWRRNHPKEDWYGY
jgi:hypothetical protein